MSNCIPRKAKRVLVVTIGVGLLAVPGALAQITTGTVSGTVFDETGAVLPSVSLELTSVRTQNVRTAVTGDTGSYRFTLLQPGEYTLQAELAGFEKLIRRDIIVQTNQIVRVDLTLKPGLIEKVVEVSGSPSELQSESGEVGDVVDRKTIVELPLNGRNFIQLIALQPGAASGSKTPGGGFSTAGLFGGQFVVHGTPLESTAFLLDGIELRDVVDSRISFQVTIDALQEFKFQATNYSAAFARAAGGVINVSSQSGAREFHGSAWEFLRNDNLDARNFFDPPTIPEFRRNQFGGALGGPLSRGGGVRFFTAYEGLREAKGVSQAVTVPTLRQRQGDFTEGNPIFNPFEVDPQTGLRQTFPGNRIPESLQSPIARNALQRLFPLPGRPGLVNNLIGTRQRVIDSDQVNVRFDGDVGNKTRIFGRYTYSETERVLPFQLSVLPNFLTDWNSIGHNTFVAMTTIFSSTVINEVKLGFNRHTQILQDADSGTPVGEQLGIQGLSKRFTGNPIMSIAGLGRTGSISNSPNNRADNSYHLIDNLSLTAGAHNISTGFNVDWNQMNGGANANAVGSFSFNGALTSQLTPTGALQGGTGNAVADFLLGLAQSTSRCCTEGDGFRNYRSISFGAYLQDDWKISPRLTLNLGVRYEVFEPPYERRGRAAQPNLAGRPNLVLDFAGQGNVPRGFAKTDLNNWAPRVGFAWTPADKTVLRGGYGIFYQFNDFRPVFAQAQTPPFVVVENFISSQTRPELTLADPFPSGRGIPGLSFASIDFNFVAPYIQSWNLAVSREIDTLSNTVLSLTYVGNKGTKLILFEDINMPPLPGLGAIGPRRPIPSIGTDIRTTNRGKSTYHALEVRGEKRFAQDFGFLGSYTWSHCIDVGGIMRLGDSPGAIRDPKNNNANRGNCENDIRNRAAANFMYDLPFKSSGSPVLNALFAGWGVRSIITLEDGQPFTVFLPFDNSGTGRVLDTPDPVPGQNPNAGPRTVEQFFNIAAFQRPAPLPFGTVGRGTVVGPGVANVDFSLHRTFPLRENHRVDLRVEIFNLFNRPSFFQPGNRFGTPTFGVISRADEAREIQFGIKYQF